MSREPGPSPTAPVPPPGRRAPRLGAILAPAPIGGGPLRAGTLADNARMLEALGFGSLWVFDAVGRGVMLPDPLQALTVAAAVTEQVELGTGVLQLPIRNPAEVAHRAFTLQLTSANRFVLGLGPGSSAPDFEVMGASYDTRFTRFEQAVAELRGWLTAAGHDGRTLQPWPEVAGGPPIVLASWRGRWIERAAREADGWIASGAYADDATLARGIARYRAAGGRRAMVTNVQVGEDPGPAMDRVRHLVELGFDDVIVFDLHPTEARLRTLRDLVPAL